MQPVRRVGGGSGSSWELYILSTHSKPSALSPKPPAAGPDGNSRGRTTTICSSVAYHFFINSSRPEPQRLIRHQHLKHPKAQIPRQQQQDATRPWMFGRQASASASMRHTQNHLDLRFRFRFDDRQDLKGDCYVLLYRLHPWSICSFFFWRRERGGWCRGLKKT